MGIGSLEKPSDFNLADERVKIKLQERYGFSIPLDEKVISPAAMFAFDQLEIVKEN